MKKLAIAIIFLGIAVIGNTIVNMCQPTRAEVKAMIKADTTSIFHINNAGILESCLYTLVEIEINDTFPSGLVDNLKNLQKWLADRNEQRIEEENEKFNDE